MHSSLSFLATPSRTTSVCDYRGQSTVVLHSLKGVLVHFATVGYNTEVPSSGTMTTLVGIISFTGQLIIQVSLIAAVAVVVYWLSPSKSKN